MQKWLVGIVSVIIVIGIVFAVANKKESDQLFDNQEEIENSFGDLGQDTDIPDDKITNVGEGVEQIDFNKNKTMQLSKPEITIDVSMTYQVILTTSEGNIVVELDVKNTPITANNFVYLAEKDFYDNTIFHRVIDGFIIQGGDPQGTGMGGPGYKFEDEPVIGQYTRGTVAMANSGPNTNGSQFFIMHQDYPLPPNYVIFGKVVEGMEIVDKIATAPVKTSSSGENSSPINPVTVQEVSIISR